MAERHERVTQARVRYSKMQRFVACAGMGALIFFAAIRLAN
jgi:hypothetical protein